jgi:hypothetical protein
MTWLLEREYVDHLLFMAGDPRGGTGGGGFYRPSTSRFGWAWLRQHLDKNGDGAISFEEFSGPREWFEALDKNQDGALTAEDFEWYGDSALARAAAKSKSLFTQIDRDGNGQVTADEWKLWYESLSGSKRYIAQDDLLPLFMDKQMAAGRGPARAGGSSAARSRLPVICSYLAGDVGALSEGPGINDRAPDFVLGMADGKEKLSLSRHEGVRPLVLIFGSFT